MSRDFRAFASPPVILVRVPVVEAAKPADPLDTLHWSPTDVLLAPILWRLPAYGIRLRASDSLASYTTRVFRHPAFELDLEPPRPKPRSTQGTHHDAR